MKTKVRHLTLEIKSFAEDGTFAGYGSVFGVKDSYGDVVVKGAFQNSLTTKMPKLLWQHRSDTPIGVLTSAFEDAKGLKIEGKLALETTTGNDAYHLMKMGAIDGLSIGYYLKKFDVNKEEKTLYIQDVDLLEVSLVTFPANQESLVETVKSEFLGSSLNNVVANFGKRLHDVECMLLRHESKIAEGSVEDETAEAETHAFIAGEDDGAKKEALDSALTKLLATFQAK